MPTRWTGWHARNPARSAAVVFDPPYTVGTPVRGRKDGAAGSVSGPLSFMQRTMSLCARTLRPGGIVIIIGDYKRLPDLMYAATTSGLRLSGCVAWVRTRPGTGGLFRSSWDPVLIASRGTPDAVDRAAVRKVIETDDDVVYANYPAKRTHPYEKPPEVLGHILARVCRHGDLVLDPFAGSGSSRVAAEKLGLDLVLERLRYRPAVRGDDAVVRTPQKGSTMSATLTKTAERAVNSKLRVLRSERRNWLGGKYTHWGMPWCAGPGSPHHQELCCEGCATVAWCRNRAAQIAGQISQLEASLVPPVQGALW